MYWRLTPTEQSPSWEATNFSPIQRIPRSFRKWQIHHRAHNNSPLVPILSQINPVHNLPFCSFKIHFNIIFTWTHIFWVISFIVMYSYCMFMYLHHANWHSSATLTEVFPWFFLSCKANPRLKPAKTEHGSHCSKFLCCSMQCLFCVVLCIVCMCVCVCVCVWMCTVLLSPGGYPFAVNTYININMFYHQHPVCTSLLLLTCLKTHPSYSLWCDHPGIICWWVQIVNLRTCSFIHFWYHFLPARPRNCDIKARSTAIILQSVMATVQIFFGEIQTTIKQQVWFNLLEPEAALVGVHISLLTQFVV